MFLVVLKVYIWNAEVLTRGADNTDLKLTASDYTKEDCARSRQLNKIDKRIGYKHE